MPFHITVRSNNRDWFGLSRAEVWTIMEDYLFFIHHAYGVKIIAFVLMDNHFHLLVLCPLGNISEAMAYFLRETSKRIASKSGRINHIYGSRFYRTLIKNNHYFQHAYKYLYRNPVEAGICQRPEEYLYSTLSGLLGITALRIPLTFDDTLFESVEHTLSWLNEAPSLEKREMIRKALRRSVFKLPRDPLNGQRNPLENLRY